MNSVTAFKLIYEKYVYFAVTWGIEGLRLYKIKIMNEMEELGRIQGCRA